jgi:hypothetical protein
MSVRQDRQVALDALGARGEPPGCDHSARPHRRHARSRATQRRGAPPNSGGRGDGRASRSRDHRGAARQRHVPGHADGTALVKVPGRILLVVGVFRRHAVEWHGHLVAALCRAAGGADDCALGSVPKCRQRPARMISSRILGFGVPSHDRTALAFKGVAISDDPTRERLNSAVCCPNHDVELYCSIDSGCRWGS